MESIIMFLKPDHTPQQGRQTKKVSYAVRRSVEEFVLLITSVKYVIRERLLHRNGRDLCKCIYKELRIALAS